jgi:hypothetical protein
VLLTVDPFNAVNPFCRRGLALSAASQRPGDLIQTLHKIPSIEGGRTSLGEYSISIDEGSLVPKSQPIEFTYDPTFYWGTDPSYGPFAGVTLSDNSIEFSKAQAGSNFRVIAGTSRDKITRLTNVDKLRFAVDFSQYDNINQPFVNVNTYLVSRYDGMTPVTYRDSSGNIQGNTRYYDAQGGGDFNTYGIELDIFESNGYAFFQHTGHASETLFEGHPDPAKDANGGAWTYSSSSENNGDNMLNTAIDASGNKVYKPPGLIPSESEANIVTSNTYRKFRYEVDLPQETGEDMQIRRYDFDDSNYSGSYDLIWDSSWDFPGQNQNPVDINSIIDANRVGLYMFAGAQQGFVPNTGEYVATSYYPNDPRITMGWSDIEAIYSDSYSANGTTLNKTAQAKRQSLTGTSQSDNIRGSATASNLLSGRNGFDLLSGGSNTDELNGGAHADVLIGGAGNDELNGGIGGDWLNGGEGRDLLIGGSGADRYIYESVSDSGLRKSADTISEANFNNQDKIAVSRLLNEGSRFQFINDQGFTGKAGEFRLDGNSLTGDLDGDQQGDFSIRFRKSTLSFLGSEDFIA